MLEAGIFFSKFELLQQEQLIRASRVLLESLVVLIAVFDKRAFYLLPQEQFAKDGFKIQSNCRKEA